MATNVFEVRRLSGSIGAEILGIDLASEPDDDVIGEIRQVWLEHNVIFFRDLDLPPAKFRLTLTGTGILCGHTNTSPVE